MAVRVVYRLVELILRQRQNAVIVGADVRCAHAHGPLGRGAVRDELESADPDPFVAEACVQVCRLHRRLCLWRTDHHVGAVGQLVVLATVLVGKNVIGIGAGVVYRRQTTGVEQL